MWPQACDRDASRPLGKVFRADRTGRRPQGGPITSWRDSLSHLGWECPEVLQEGLLGGDPAAIISNTNPLRGGKRMMDQDVRICLLYGVSLSLDETQTEHNIQLHHIKMNETSRHSSRIHANTHKS